MSRDRAPTLDLFSLSSKPLRRETGRLIPDFKTIADFRKDNGEAIRKVCRAFVLLCRRLELLGDASVAIDGSKFKAVNNRDKNFTEAKMKRRLEQIDQSIARYLSQLDTADRQGPTVPEAKTTRLKEKIATLRQEIERLNALNAQMMASEDKQISLKDPDARSPPTLQRALRRSDRDLPAYFDDAVAGKAEEIADMHGVSLHRGEKRLLPFSQTLPVGPVNDRFAGDVIGDVVGIEAAALLARLSQKRRNVRPFHESIAGRHAPEIRRNLDRRQALGRLDPRDGLDHNPENEQVIVQ